MTVLWVAQAVTVTNGQKEVIVTSAPGNAITKVETSATFHGVGFSLPYEIERTYNNGTNDVIVLYENWAGSSGSIAAVAVPSGAAVTRAADSLEALKTVYESLADSVSTTAVANGIPKYSSQGRLKAAAGSASDDVMVKSQFSPGAFGPDCRTFGYGVDDLQDFSGDLNTLVTTGNYLAVSASTNTPSSIHAHYVQVVASNGSNSIIQYAQRKTSDQARQYTYMRQRENGVWSIWFPTWMQDYGLRNNRSIVDYANYHGVANSVDVVVETGFYSGFGGAHASATGGDNPFPTQNGAFTLEVQKVFNADGLVAYVKQVATRLESNSSIVEIKFRAASNEANGWSDWSEVYGSHNLKLETYYISSGKTLKNYAIAQNPTTVDFDLEGFSTADPSSLTVEYGSFNIIANSDGTVVGSNVVPTLAPTSTGRTPVARFTVSGAVTGQSYRAVSVSGGARFKINWA